MNAWTILQIILAAAWIGAVILWIIVIADIIREGKKT